MVLRIDAASYHPRPQLSRGQLWAKRTHRCVAAALAAALALTGCASGATARPTTTGSVSTPSGQFSSGAPSPRPAAVATVATCAAAVDATQLQQVHHFTTSPDDIAVDAAGRLWVTERDANQLVGLSADGSAVTTQPAAGGPEGVAVDGSTIYVAEQNLNAIAVVAPRPRMLVTFPNRTANLGVDGIAIDAANGRLLVPDSPTGQLLAVSLTGSSVPQLIAGNLGRPVDAVVDSAADIIVASESSPGLTVLGANGSRRSLGHFADLDEVVAYAGLLYVTELDRHDVVAVDPNSGASVAIAINLPAPQGLAVTATGILEIVDATTNTLYSLPACAASR